MLSHLGTDGLTIGLVVMDGAIDDLGARDGRGTVDERPV